MKKAGSSAALLAVVAALPVAADGMRIGLSGEVDEEQAVAAEVSPSLYYGTSHGPDALAAELRVVDGSGNAVPYVVRPAARRVVSEREVWRRLDVVSAVETNGELVVEAEWPDGERAPTRFISLKVSTRLADFEQRVAVFADGVQLAEGEICDRRKFADVRNDVVPMDAHFRRRLQVVFSSPVAEVAARDYERMVVQGAESGTATRRGFTERAFRVDALSVSFPEEVVSYEPAPPLEVCMAAEPRHDGKAKKTVFEFDAAHMPVTAVSLDVKDRNFSRTVKVLKRANGGWREVASGRIGSIDLPGEKARNLSVPLQGELSEGLLRVEVEDMDNPPLQYGERPLKLLARACDVVFLAKPGVKYALAVEKGAERPQYDSQVLDYLLKTRTLRRMECAAFDGDGALGGKTVPTASWMSVNPVAVASAVAFIVLVALSVKLFRSSVKDEGPRRNDKEVR